MTASDDEVFAWYAQFSFPAGTKWDHERHNFFAKVPLQDIKAAERAIGMTFPKNHVRFLTEVGEGVLRLDMEGRNTHDYANWFWGPTDIESLVDGTADDWLTYEELIGPRELPMFGTGQGYHYVFDMREGSADAVYSPHKLRKIADSFMEFLDKLRHNSTFYKGSYSDTSGLQ